MSDNRIVKGEEVFDPEDYVVLDEDAERDVAAAEEQTAVPAPVAKKPGAKMKLPAFSKKSPKPKKDAKVKAAKTKVRKDRDAGDGGIGVDGAETLVQRIAGLFKANPLFSLLAALSLIALLAVLGLSLFTNFNLFSGQSVAIVNGESIFARELDEEFALFKAQNEVLFDPANNFMTEDEAKKVLLDQMIDNMLIRQEASKRNIRVTSNQIQQLLDGQIAASSNPDTFEDDLKASGASIDKLKEQIEVSLLVQQILADMVPESSITDAEVLAHLAGSTPEQDPDSDDADKDVDNADVSPEEMERTRTYLLNEKRNNAWLDLIDNLRREATIEYLDVPIAPVDPSVGAVPDEALEGE